MAQTGYTPILIYASGTATNVPLAANLTSSASGAELALNYADGKLYYKNSSGTVTLLASTAGASGDVVGPASATDNALARFDLTTGKLIQNSVGILSDAGALSGITDISASGSITLSGGTANGVAYLNGSKVLTTGSALVFDGSNLGLGVTPSNWDTLTAFQIKNGSVYGFSTSDVSIGANNYYGTSNFRYITSSVAAGKYTISGNQHAWYIAPSGTAGNAITFTQAMTLDASGNLGIGTTTPQSPLQVKSTTRPQLSVSYDGITGLYLEDSSNSFGKSWKLATSSAVASALEFYQSTATSGVPVWAATAAMTLDASGNLGVGTTSPPTGYRAQFVDTRAADSVAIGVRNLSSSGITRYVLGNDIGFARMTMGYTGSTFVNPSIGWIGTEGSEPFYFQTAGTERARFDSSGNFGVGTTSPSTGKFGDASCAVLVQSSDPAYGTNIFSSNSNNTKFVGFWSGHSSADSAVGVKSGTALTFGAWGAINGAGGFSEWGRFDSSGNLLVGTTNASGSAGVGSKILSTAAGFIFAQVTAASTDGAATSYNYYSTGGGAYRFYVGAGGTIFATSIVISAISDQRLKENVRDIDAGLNSIMALKPRRFDWKEGKGQDKKNVAGFIAQEFEDVFPECVSTSMAGEDGIEYKNINHETLIPTLVKAIQEQQALITQLTARITALEGA
jgi:hypothetical protein